MHIYIIKHIKLRLIEMQICNAVNVNQTAVAQRLPSVIKVFHLGRRLVLCIPTLIHATVHLEATWKIVKSYDFVSCMLPQRGGQRFVDMRFIM